MREIQIYRLLLQLVILYLVLSIICWNFNVGEWGWFPRLLFLGLGYDRYLDNK